MRGKFLIPSLMVLWPLATSWAQLAPPNGAGVTMGFLHMVVPDVQANKKLWVSLGGVPVKIDEIEAVKFPGVMVLLTHGSPSGNNKGAVLDHFGFHVRAGYGDELFAKMKAAGVPVEPDPDRHDHGYIYTPEHQLIEIAPGDKSQTLPIISDHLHYLMPNAIQPQAQAWYAKTLGAESRKAYAEIPGIEMRFGRGAEPVTEVPLPTKGRTMDRIGFEVVNLEAFCKRLEASGVKFDKPYNRTLHKSFASAELTDPWGTSIELTEGLNRF
jgi:catechol 2,3-dioxygenase-like lactoylglutathione lyase family enzyme